MRLPLQSLLSQEPAAQLIRSTARQQWRLIVLNLGSSLVEAFTEVATLAVVFLAVEVLSAPADTPFNWASNPFLSRLPAAANWLNGLPATGVFATLLALQGAGYRAHPQPGARFQLSLRQWLQGGRPHRLRRPGT